MFTQGLDLDKLAAKKRFGFVDGLSGLFLPKQKAIPRMGEKVLSNFNLRDVAGEIQEAIQILREGGGKVMLAIDQLDLLLAAGGDHITPVAMGDVLTELRGASGSFL
jgi:elongator complex protein 6